MEPVGASTVQPNDMLEVLADRDHKQLGLEIKLLRWLSSYRFIRSSFEMFISVLNVQNIKLFSYFYDSYSCSQCFL